MVLTGNSSEVQRLSPTVVFMGGGCNNGRLGEPQRDMPVPVPVPVPVPTERHCNCFRLVVVLVR